MNNQKILNKSFYELSEVILQNLDLIYFDNKKDSDKFIGDYPKNFHLSNLVDVEGSSGLVLDTVRQFVKNIESYYDLVCTLCVYYPPEEGFIDWHTNKNANFYNAICTFSLNGDSFFEYINKDNHVIAIQDFKGWSVKKTLWGNDSVIPHRAITNTHRISITFSSKYENIVDAFIDQIT